METSFHCPDCGHADDEPALATLGFRIRCLDCQIEVDLAFELRTLSVPQVAA